MHLTYTKKRLYAVVLAVLFCLIQRTVWVTSYAHIKVNPSKKEKSNI